MTATECTCGPNGPAVLCRVHGPDAQAEINAALLATTPIGYRRELERTMSEPAPAAGGTHACPGGCGRRVARHLYACKACWMRLPYTLRQPISASYQRDAAAHSAAMAAAASWYSSHAGVRS